MKIKSAAVRNYRVHKDISVDLNDDRLLFEGPNESGKSTFVEALHRCFFLKAKITGETRESMVSNIYPGHPEVKVVFEAEGDTYSLIKIFSGQTGSIKLNKESGESWNDQEAENRLSELLAVESQCGGRGVANDLAKSWAHLWVWQGKSGDNPAKEADQERDRIIQNMQKIGGAAVVQSQLDTDLAEHFKSIYEQAFRQDGKPKAGSELDKAQKELAEAEKRFKDANEKCSKLLQAVEDYQNAEDEIKQCNECIDKLQGEREENLSQIKQAEKLENDINEQAEQLKIEVEKLNSLKDTEETIEGFRKEINGLKHKLKPREENLDTAKKHLENLKKKQEAAEKEENAASATVEGLRGKLELARAWKDYFQQEEETSRLKEFFDRKQSLKSQISGLEKDFAKLPNISESDLKELKDTQTELNENQAVLNSMAAQISVVQSNQQVLINDEEASVNTTKTVTDSVDLKVGQDVLLRIKPGGGDALNECRQRLQDLKDKFSGLLVNYGVNSIEEAEECYKKREEIKGNITALNNQIAGFDDGTLDAKLNDAEVKLTGIHEEVKRRKQNVESAPEPGNKEEAENTLKSEVQNEAKAREHAADMRNERKSVEDALKESQQELDTLNQELDSLKKDIADKESRLSQLLRQSGEDVERQKKLNDIQELVSELQRKQKETTGNLQHMMPDSLKQAKDRIERALKTQTDKLEAAKDKKSTNKGILNSSGTHDPKADAQRAEADVKNLKERLENINIKAQSIQLLHSLFQEQQKELMETMTKPLEEKITFYLQAVFGPQAKAKVNYDGSSFSGFDLVRPNKQNVPFDALSGGTKEQVAAAARLAIAEILAADHGGSLPVVFDDAFVNSDPGRIKLLQGMLDLAASKGLQVIVLTCNPSEYAGLGAKGVKFV
ncbi:AAA family ATPase [Desulfonatronovibrio magnus]|uniref:AAA family ATPase n=1 Tax=Desulfonatronovibrio magnus TaxID=698827 RepID=UPI0005EAEAFD|nr:AAA family ATPase [Desulfonatronovibrio magnus]